MNLTIDWVSAVILLATYAFSQIRSVSLRLRYLVMAAGFVVIAVYRYRIGAFGINMVFVIAAAAFAVWYLVRAFQSSAPGSRD